ncbi:O-antigen polymerase [Acinetobacter towneri]
MVLNFMRKIIFFNLMLISCVISLLVFSHDYYVSILLTVFNVFLTFYLINDNKYSINIINPQTILLLGMSVLIFGRFFSVLLDPNQLASIFCIDFIFYYCSSLEEAFKLIIYLNSILVFFSLAFIIPVKENNIKYSKDIYSYLNQKKILIVFTVGVLSALYSIFENFNKIQLVIGSGYLALYEGQSEGYETPYSLVLGSISIASLALLFSLKDFSFNSKKLFNILFFIVVLKSLILIATGARSSFISGLILLIWYIFYNKELKIKHYLILSLSFFVTISTVNYLASLSGARIIDNIERSFLGGITYIFYNQGVSLMVFDISLKYSDYPVLGFWKVIFPGIQIFYNIFGVTERKDFNWSSYVVYNENYGAYVNGNGLGWSLYSDFYAFSFGFLPLFCIYVYCFSRFIVKAISSNRLYFDGVVLIMIYTFFAINRSSISIFIFILIFYTLMYLFFVKFKWK